MKVRIPKSMRGVFYPQVLTINLNSFDIDLFFPSLFFAVLGYGAPYGKRNNASTAIQTYIERLAHHADLENFDTPEGAKLLERFVRSNLVIIGRKGRSRTQEQILALEPLSILTGKSGFPGERSRLRNVDSFLYQALVSAQGGSRFNGERTLRDHFKTLFGRGVVIDEPPTINGHYDGQTSLDTMTRMELAFLDGLQATMAARQNNRSQPQASCPALAEALGKDILGYLFSFSDLMPTAALTSNLKALVNLELFVYTLKVVHAINALVDDPEHLPAAMTDTVRVSPPELYLDFTGSRGRLSSAMATYCVRRDIEAYQRFLSSNLLLRQLGNYAEQLRRVPAQRARIEDIVQGSKDGPLYLQGLLLLERDSELNRWLEVKAADEEHAIRQEYATPEEDEADLAAIDAIAAGAPSSVRRVVALLTEGQGRMPLHNLLEWYRSVGGIQKPYGIITGTSNARQSWRYAPSNDFLAALVQLASIEVGVGIHPNQAKFGEKTHPQPIRLREFLDYLERRFGILVDRPPSTYSGAEASAAARENLRAMLDRLRQMGIFSDMSDDFTVQRLQPPYADSHSASLLSQRS